MWSFDHDDPSNRAYLRVGDSRESPSQSFDAIGSSSEVRMNSSNRQSEISVGLTISEGQGKVSVISRGDVQYTNYIVQAHKNHLHNAEIYYLQ